MSPPEFPVLPTQTVVPVVDGGGARRGLTQPLILPGADVTALADRNESLAHERGFDFAFCVSDLMLPGAQGIRRIPSDTDPSCRVAGSGLFAGRTDGTTTGPEGRAWLVGDLNIGDPAPPPRR